MSSDEINHSPTAAALEEKWRSNPLTNDMMRKISEDPEPIQVIAVPGALG